MQLKLVHSLCCFQPINLSVPRSTKWDRKVVTCIALCHNVLFEATNRSRQSNMAMSDNVVGWSVVTLKINLIK